MWEEQIGSSKIPTTSPITIDHSPTITTTTSTHSQDTSSSIFMRGRDNRLFALRFPALHLASMAVCLGLVLLLMPAIFLFAANTTKFNDGMVNGRNHHQFLLASSGLAQQKEVNAVRNSIFSSISPERMASTLRMVTREPHIAGTEQNRRVAKDIAQLWRSNGLEGVKLLEYDVLLSYPNWNVPNRATVFSESGQVLFRSTGLSPDLIPPEGGGNDPKATIQWLAYSGNGTAVGEPVYCHYGAPEDFERLEREFGIGSLKGKIAILRYGYEYRGDKVKHAQDRGAAGAILFSDPAEVANFGTEAVFPKTDRLPSVGVQRGALNEGIGDPGTPLLPSRKDFYREKTVEQCQHERLLPTIPVLPMGFGEAQELLSRMGGPEVPADWRGGLDLTYRIGPGFRQGQGQKLQLDVQSSLEVKTIQNVIGMIRGREEPDSWVMLGNHYDAWVYGALDPNSGTAILAEVGRAFAEMVKTGWRPRRTIVFCNWDAEEHLIGGSNEFVEEYADILKDRAIVYMNVDLISGNETLDVKTVPSLYGAVTAAAKVVPNPVAAERAQGRPMVYDTWRQHFPPEHKWLPDVPRMNVPGGGSDHISFLSFLGIPVVDFRYRADEPAFGRQYPLYHSRYEVPFVNEHLFDHDNLAVHKAVGQYWAEMARSFADDPVLPISADIFAQKLLKHWFTDLQTTVQQLHAKHPRAMESAQQQMAHLMHQAALFAHEASDFTANLHNGIHNTQWAERTNRRLRRLDQCFTNPAMGLAAQEPVKRHILFSISDNDLYTGSVMAAVSSKISQISRETDEKKLAQLGEQLAMELTVVQYSVLCATNMLKPFF